jgi:hypothetical protein
LGGKELLHQALIRVVLGNENEFQGFTSLVIFFGEFYRDERIFDVAQRLGIRLTHHVEL